MEPCPSMPQAPFHVEHRPCATHVTAGPTHTQFRGTTWTDQRSAVRSPDAPTASTSVQRVTPIACAARRSKNLEGSAGDHVRHHVVLGRADRGPRTFDPPTLPARRPRDACGGAPLPVGSSRRPRFHVEPGRSVRVRRRPRRPVHAEHASPERRAICGVPRGTATATRGCAVSDRTGAVGPGEVGDATLRVRTPGPGAVRPRPARSHRTRSPDS